MNAWELPTSLCVNGVVYPMHTDFRVILNLLTDLNDPDLFEPRADEREKSYVTAYIILRALFGKNFEKLPRSDWQEAVEKAVEFIDMGIKEDKRRKPHTMDWKQDASIIIPAVNRVQGCEIRSLPYLHWWTFLGAYLEIGGDCLFSQIINIRTKKSKGKKLEKWEKEFYAENKNLVDLKKRYSEEELEYQKYLEKILSGEV